MSLLRTLRTNLKIIAIMLVRFYVLILGAWGVYGLVTGQYLMAAAGLIIPVIYLARFAWRGYQDTPDADADADVAS